MAGDDSILTEGEIDALMESVDEAVTGSDASDDGQFRRFDFSAREHSLLREFTALAGVLERQADLLAAALEDAFSIEFSARALPAQLASVADTLASLERAVGVSTAPLAPLSGHLYAVVTQDLLSFIVNAYFGGGINPATNAPPRATLTPTELRVAERVAELQCRCLGTAWADKIPIEAGDIITLGTPDRLEMLPPAELLLRLRFQLRAGEGDYSVDLYLPFEPLEPYRERFAPPRRRDDVDAGSSWEPFFRRELPTIEVELAGVLATRPIALSELLELAPGAVIPIPPPEIVSVRADGVTVAEGRYGSFDGLKAVQLQRLGSALPDATR